MPRFVLLAMCVVLVTSSFCIGGSNPGAKVAVHVTTHFEKRSCTNQFPTIGSCEDIVYSLESGDADCFPVFFNLEEYLGCEYGLTWPGTYSCTFTSCSDLTIGGIVYPGDGVSHTWVSCQSDDIAIPGWAWIYEADSARVCVIDHPQAFAVSVLDCSEGLDEPAEDPFCAGIAGELGDDPCDVPVANASSSWGAIKTLFR